MEKEEIITYYNFYSDKNGKLLFTTKFKEIAEDFLKRVQERVIKKDTDIIDLGDEIIIIRDYIIKIWWKGWFH